jgi:hemerythrin
MEPMPLITWTKALSVGIAEIDEQHRELVRLINVLHEAMKAGKGALAVGSTLTALIEYTEHHFATEERLFKETEYPAAMEHNAQHRDFAKKVQGFKAMFDEDIQVGSLEILELLRNWLSDHIKGSDKKYTAHFHARGIR